MATLKLKKEFKELLESHEAFDNYVNELTFSFRNLTKSEVNFKVNQLNEISSIDELISSSFLWSNTTQGHEYWNFIYLQYHN